MTTPAPWDIISALAHRFDACDAEREIQPEESHLLQVLKIGEEFGEAAQAVIGARGTNPRKGHSHTWEDVHDEVCDVIITGMVALARMRPDAAAYFAGQLELKAGAFLSPSPPSPQAQQRSDDVEKCARGKNPLE
ncbi:MazG-like family protein [Streptomyces sp. NPDC058655]|uniref:MazG-like family protein n=1 Tax=unclassified Streptomyces TaxID=2593676 RepID=UPI0036622F38